MARAKGFAEENPGGRLTTKTSQYASPSISIAWCINGRQADASRTSAFICALPTRSAAVAASTLQHNTNAVHGRKRRCLLRRTRWSSVPLCSCFPASRTHTMFTNLACASPSASMYLLVVVRLACPAKA